MELFASSFLFLLIRKRKMRRESSFPNYAKNESSDFYREGENYIIIPPQSRKLRREQTKLSLSSRSLKSLNTNKVLRKKREGGAILGKVEFAGVC
jgi:hypothetical protein